MTGILNQIGHVENPSARIGFLEVAQTTPGQCGICGKGQSKEGFADTNLDFEFWGRLIICVDCAGQIAAVFGFISSIDYDELLGEKDLAQLQLHQANDRVLELERLLDAFTSLRSSGYTVSSGTLNPDVSSLQETASESNESESGAVQDVSGNDEVEPIKSGATAIITGKQGPIRI